MMIDRCVHRNEAFDAAVQQDVRISVEELGVVTVSNGKKKEIFLSKVSFDPADNQRAVKVADLLRHDTDRVCALYPQVAGIETRPITQLAGSREDSLLGVLGNRSGCSRFVQNRGNDAFSKAHALGNYFQGDVTVFLTTTLPLLGCHSAIAPNTPRKIALRTAPRRLDQLPAFYLIEAPPNSEQT